MNRIQIVAAVLSLTALVSLNGSAASADDSPATPTKAENAIAKQFAETSKKQLNEPVPVLAKMAAQLGQAINARLEYDVEIARTKTWEKQLRLSLSSLRAEADKLREERKEVRGRLDAALVDARQRYASDPHRLDTEVVDLVKHFRPELVDLKNEEAAYTRDADATSARLDEVTRRREKLERSRAWASESRSSPIRRETLAIPDLDLGPAPDLRPSAGPEPGGRTMSAADAIQLLKDL